MPHRDPVHGTASLVGEFLTIKVKGRSTVYRVANLHPDLEAANPAWRLTKSDGTFYDVHVDQHGASCTCPDWIWCREHKDSSGCKHCRGLQAVGLLRKEKS